MEAMALYTANNSNDSVLDGIRERSQSYRRTKTPPSLISERVGGGGKKFKYLKPNPFYEWLDEKYPGWSFEADLNTAKELAGFVYIQGTLTVFEKEGVKRTMTRVGCDEAIIKRDTGELTNVPYYKAAETDALKRCVMALGGFADVYMDAETSSAITTPEELTWYIETVIPYHLSIATPATTIFKQMSAFASGVVNKQQISERYKL